MNRSKMEKYLPNGYHGRHLPLSKAITSGYTLLSALVVAKQNITE